MKEKKNIVLIIEKQTFERIFDTFLDDEKFQLYQVDEIGMYMEVKTDIFCLLTINSRMNAIHNRIFSEVNKEKIPSVILFDNLSNYF